MGRGIKTPVEDRIAGLMLWEQVNPQCLDQSQNMPVTWPNPGRPQIKAVPSRCADGKNAPANAIARVENAHSEIRPLLVQGRRCCQAG